MYDICKKTVILVRFEVTLLETKYIACKIVNKGSLNVKNRAFRGLTKTHPSGMSKTAVIGVTNRACMQEIELWCHGKHCEILDCRLYCGTSKILCEYRTCTRT